MLHTLQWLNPVFIYSFLRAKIYSSGFKSQLKLSVAVVSVGNLQFGGSGKTPFVMCLLNRYKKYKIAVVSQSYKGQMNQPEQVDISKINFQSYFGDEPSLIQQAFPKVDVWSGPIKWKTAKAASETKKYDLIIVDDGFTHHQLFRDVDLLLIDGSRPLDSYRLPPFGFLRETWTACNRAHAVIITKIKSLADRDDLVKMVQPYNKRTSFANYVSQTSEVKPNVQYFLFAGIGNFEFFHNHAKELGVSIHSSMSYENHVEYTKSLQQEILQNLVRFNLRGLTTAKDRIKLTIPELLEQTDCLFVDVQLEKSMEQWLDESIMAAVTSKIR